jgi:hypothetical protein
MPVRVTSSKLQKASLGAGGKGGDCGFSRGSPDALRLPSVMPLSESPSKVSSSVPAVPPPPISRRQPRRWGSCFWAPISAISSSPFWRTRRTNVGS